MIRPWGVVVVQGVSEDTVTIRGEVLLWTVVVFLQRRMIRPLMMVVTPVVTLVTPVKVMMIKRSRR